MIFIIKLYDYFIPYEFSTTVLTISFLLKFEGQQVLSALQDSDFNYTVA